MKAIMKRAWEIFRTLTGDHIAKLAMALRMAWAEKKNGGKKMEEKEAVKLDDSPLTSGEPKTISTRYRKGDTRAMFRGAYDDEALDASFDSKNGVLRFDYANDKDWSYNDAPSNKYKHLDITVYNGMINGEPVNLDLNSSKIKAVEGVYLSDKSVSTLKKAGFDYNSSTKRYEKGYKGYSVSGTTLNVDSKLPDDFTKYPTIKTKYGAVDTSIIKKAGYKWNGIDKVWVKKI